MKSFVPASGFIIALSVLSIVVACSSSEGDNSSSTSSSSGSSGSTDKAPADCVTQCTAQASGCSQDSSHCSQLCATITGTQFACVKAAGCDQDAASDCMKSGGTSSGTSGTSSGTSGTSGGQCIGLGKNGCSSSNAPSNCCTDSTRPDISCNANNDGKGNAQCCVNTGKTCVEDSDCCGNASNPQVFKCCPSKKCGSGC